jgi:hypothetical protein
MRSNEKWQKELFQPDFRFWKARFAGKQCCFAISASQKWHWLCQDVICFRPSHICILFDLTSTCSVVITTLALQAGRPGSILGRTSTQGSASTTACSKILLQFLKFLFSHKISLPPKRWKKSRKFRQMYHRPYEKLSIITLPENLGKLSRVLSMKVSAPRICLCSSRGVRCLIMVEGLNGRRRWTANFEIYSP